MDILEKSIKDLVGFRIGQAEDITAMTGITIIQPMVSAKCACAVLGGAPASRENALLSPLADNESVNAVILSGGSAFGLDASRIVVEYLRKNHIGFYTPYGLVPIVVESCLYDLGIGEATRLSDEKVLEACQSHNYTDGCYGAGCGATIGKLLGMDYAMKSGIGSSMFTYGGLQVAAIVAVNAVGDVYENGKKIAGVRTKENNLDLSSDITLMAKANNLFTHTNTTIGCILTNANLSKTKLTKVAYMGHDGMARAISPVHTSFDGDSLYALSTCDVDADMNFVGTLASKAVYKAIIKAIKSANAYLDLPAYSSFF